MVTSIRSIRAARSWLQGATFVIAGALVGACSGNIPAVTAGLPSPQGPTPLATPSAGATPVAGPSPTPAITGLTGHLIFTRAGRQFGDETIFVSRLDGSEERQLSELGRSCCPWALPDGSRVVIGDSSPDGRLTVAILGLDGSGKVVLPLPKGTLNLATGPVSGNGNIAREGFDDGDPDAGGIYLTSIDGTNVRRLTSEHYIPGDFSPDGKEIVAFQGPADVPPPAGSLYVITVKTGDVRPLTPTGTQVQCCTNYRWSPDGSKILFATPQGALWTIAPDGTGLNQIFKDPGGRWAISPTWSPDGTMIIFGLDPSANPFVHPSNGLYVIRSDGSGLTLVLGGNDFKREPIWVT